MRTNLAVLVPVLGLGLVACASSSPRPRPAPSVASATLSSGSADPCAGAQFDADDPDPRCLRFRADDSAVPAPDALAVDVRADKSAKAGHGADLVVSLRNVSGAPLVLDVDSACAWGATATDGVNSSLESDCTPECARSAAPGVLHVRLEPDGVVVKKVRFFAVQTRGTLDSHDRCVQHGVGPLPPGRYTVSVHLPWGRSADVPLTVTP